ncbi:MAG: phosphoenolpyruvate carboxylase [Thermoprotei archaeon]
MIPRTMSTQHPDNARTPNWATGDVLEGEEEVHEAYLAYKRYGCQEVMWDAEGKDVDAHVVRKLLSKYPTYFRKRVIGVDVFLTYRLPNPRLEKAERKVLMETLDHIPMSYDVSSEFYGKEAHPPIFEAIMPFTQSADDLIATFNYYKEAVAGREDIKIKGDLTVKEWLGEVNPKIVSVIPLFEDRVGLTNAGSIMQSYLEHSRVSYARAFIGRSDPAMSHGMISAVLYSKVALSSLKKLEKRTGKPIYPMLGVGSLPFRGHMSPLTYKNVLQEYAGVNTFTIQSAFKYDYDEAAVRQAISDINAFSVGEATLMDNEQQVIDIADRLTAHYIKEISGLSGLVNALAALMPSRRARRSHRGIFGYGRKSGRATLPRAIVFTAAFYTIGFPPELLGLSALSKLSGSELEVVRANFKSMDEELKAAANFFSWDSFNVVKEDGIRGVKIGSSIKDYLEADVRQAEQMGIDLGPRDYAGMKHGLFSFMSLMSLNQGRSDEAASHVMEAAVIRRSLG